MKSAPYSCRLDKLSSGGDRGPFGAWERPEFVAEPTHKTAKNAGPALPEVWLPRLLRPVGVDPLTAIDRGKSVRGWCFDGLRRPKRVQIWLRCAVPADGRRARPG